MPDVEPPPARIKTPQERIKDLHRKGVLIVSLILLLVGGVMIGLSTVAPGPYWTERFEKFLNSIGSTLLVGGLLSVLAEQFTKRYFEELLTDIATTSVDTAVSKAVPPEYEHLRKAGIYDAYERFDIEEFRKSIDLANNVEIRIYTMWITNFHSIQAALERAIDHRGCNVKILLLNPEAKEPLQKRAGSLPYYDSETMALEIKKSIDIADRLHARLEHPERLELKIHNAFIAAPIYAYGETMLVGLYLSGRLSSEGTHIKVVGSTRYLYDELVNHFRYEWCRATEHNWRSVANEDPCLPGTTSKHVTDSQAKSTTGVIK